MGSPPPTRYHLVGQLTIFVVVVGFVVVVVLLLVVVVVVVVGLRVVVVLGGSVGPEVGTAVMLEYSAFQFFSSGSSFYRNLR